MTCLRCSLNNFNFPNITFWNYPTGEAYCSVCHDIKLLFSCCGGKNSTWDSKTAQWKCKDCGNVQSNDPNYLYSSPGNTKTIEKFVGTKQKKCECGGDTAKTSHAHWCPVWEKY